MKSIILLIIGLVLTIVHVSSKRLLQEEIILCNCTAVYQPSCCNDINYKNPCFAECYGCTDDEILDGEC